MYTDTYTWHTQTQTYVLYIYIYICVYICICICMYIIVYICIYNRIHPDWRRGPSWWHLSHHPIGHIEVNEAQPGAVVWWRLVVIFHGFSLRSWRNGMIIEVGAVAVEVSYSLGVSCQNAHIQNQIAKCPVAVKLLERKVRGSVQQPEFSPDGPSQPENCIHHGVHQQKMDTAGLPYIQIYSVSVTPKILKTLRTYSNHFRRLWDWMFRLETATWNAMGSTILRHQYTMPVCLSACPPARLPACLSVCLHAACMHV